MQAEPPLVRLQGLIDESKTFIRMAGHTSVRQRRGKDMNRSAVPRLLALSMLVAGMAGCEQRQADPQADGPAERAGAQLDQALSRAGEELNKIAEKTGEQLQVVGRRLQDEAQEAKSGQGDQQARQQAAAGGAERTSGE